MLADPAQDAPAALLVAALAVGAAGAALLATLPRLLARALYEPPAPAGGPWRLPDLLVAFGAGVAGTVLVSLALAVREPPEPAVVYQLAASVLGLAPAVLLPALAARLRGASALDSLGLGDVLDPRAVLVGGTTYACFVPLFLGAAGAWRVGLHALGHDPEVQAVVVALAGLDGSWWIPAGLLAVVVAPALEELIFRGFAQPLLSRYLGAAGGILVSSLLFSALHGLSAFGPILALSLVLGWLRWRTGGLAAPLLVHGLHNGLQLALLMAFPQARDLILDQEALLP